MPVCRSVRKMQCRETWGIFLIVSGCLVIGAAMIVYSRTVYFEGTAPTVAALRQTTAPRSLTRSLPSGCSNIAYHRRLCQDYQVINFTVGESSFIDWAESHGWSVDAIAGYPSQFVHVCEPGGWATARVSDGYVTGGPEPDDWWGRAVYDRQTGRAYYTRSMRSD